MPDEEKQQWYELVKHNFQNPDPTTTEVVKKVRGRGLAERVAEVLTKGLTPEEREAGFLVFLQECKRPVGVKPPKRRTVPGRRRRRNRR